jgi:hypothetical protein
VQEARRPSLPITRTLASENPPMKALRILCLFFALGAAAVALAADPTGTWKWTTRSPNGDIETTLKLEVTDGKLAGAYSNQFGDTEISNASVQDDVITFDVVRNLSGNKYAVKYRGKIEGDTIKGTIEAPGHDGGKALLLDWNAKRTEEAKPKKP